MIDVTLYNGDCLIEMNKIKDKSVDMILADLPYGTTQAKFDTVIPFEPLWEQYHRVIKDNGTIVLFGAEPFSSYLRLSNIQEYKYDWVWDKIKGTGFLNAKKQPMRCNELISVFYKNQCTYNPQMTHGYKRKVSFRRAEHQTEVYGKMNKDNLYDSTDRYPRSILEFSTDTQNSSLHPTQKPLKLLSYLIRTYTNEGETVLDNCFGSGSCGVACCATNRNFIGIELDKEYFEIGKKRIEEANQSLFEM